MKTFSTNMSGNIPEKNKMPTQGGLKLKFKSFFAQEFFHSGLTQWVFVGSFILNAVNWGLIAFFIRPVDFPLILHYNVYFGVDVIGFWWQVYFLPLIGLMILLVNAFLGYHFYSQKERSVAHLLMLATFISQIAVTIATTCIIMINY